MKTNIYLTDPETFSVAQDDSVARESESLIEVIRQHDSELREARMGQRSSIHGAVFELLQEDRNTLYRIEAEHTWYLKMPRDAQPDALEREILGAKAVYTVLAEKANYLTPAAIVASTEQPFFLATRMPGRPIHREFYLAAMLPWRRSSSQVLEGFKNLGRSTANLHANAEAEEAPLANRSIDSILNELVARRDTTDSFAQAIADWKVASAKTEDPDVLIHGNMKMENILVHFGEIGLLDFENCGRGSPSEDLSWVISQLALTKTIPGFPTRFSRRAANALLAGYRSVTNLSDDSLARFTSMRVFRYYLDLQEGKFGRARIAGLPVRIGRLQEMVSRLVDGSVNGLLWECDK